MKKEQKQIIGILALAAGIAAGAYFLMKGFSRSKTGKPSKKAPQLPLENPGDQSEFITSSSPSELG
jgi:hypothetical protein